MKRQKSISIFLAILVIILAWMYIKFSNEKNTKDSLITTENETTKEETITISQEYITYMYYIKEKDGRLVVYKVKEEEIYMETSIQTNTLPDEIRDKLDAGIFFENEGELFDFLESYSS